jgi:adenine-specific DNA-methyltransferase
MSKFEVTKIELVWPGKYNEDASLKEVPRVSLPFQVIETVNESRATREVKKVESMSLFDVYEGMEGDTFEAGWRNPSVPTSVRQVVLNNYCRAGKEISL